MTRSLNPGKHVVYVLVVRGITNSAWRIHYTLRKIDNGQDSIRFLDTPNQNKVFIDFYSYYFIKIIRRKYLWITVIERS